MVYAVCEITACQRTFSGQKCCLSGDTDICMEKMSGQSFGQLKSKTMIITYEITRILHYVQAILSMSMQNLPCPDSVNPFFKSYFAHCVCMYITYQCTVVWHTVN